jgi:hypothetical protein
MSQQKTYSIKCPECDHDQEVALYESINIGLEPVLRDALLANEVNNIQCDSCGFEFRVEKTLLYNDPPREFMVYCVPESEGNPEVVTEMIQRAVAEAGTALPEDTLGPTIHLTSTRTEMIEKIFILEAGLDPRIIEYIKYSIFTRNPEELPPREKGLLFDAEDSTDEHLLFVVQDLTSGELETVLQYTRSGYDALCEMFDKDEETADLLELFPGPYINARQAMLEEMDDLLDPEEEEL